MTFGKDKLKSTLFFAGLDADQYNAISSDLMKRNQTSLKGISGITAGYMLIMMLSSFLSDITNANRIHFIWCFFLCAGILAITCAGLLKTKFATLIAVYAYLSVIFSYGLAIGSTQTSQTAVSFLIFIMVGPLIFYDRPVHMIILVSAFVIAFLAIILTIKTQPARETDLLNGLSYGLISGFLTAGGMVLKVTHVWMENEMRIIAGTDALTHLKNRNSFEHRYPDYAKQAKRDVTCIYIDANGLHKINNTEGHEAGDRMLRCLAEEIVALFGDENAYRIGGDEYMIFCCDEPLDRIRQKVAELSERMDAKNYSFSSGIVNAPVKGIDMEKMIAEADQEMYRAKKSFYENVRNDRRRS